MRTIAPDFTKSPDNIGDPAALLTPTAMKVLAHLDGDALATLTAYLAAFRADPADLVAMWDHWSCAPTRLRSIINTADGRVATTFTQAREPNVPPIERRGGPSMVEQIRFSSTDHARAFGADRLPPLAAAELAPEFAQKNVEEIIVGDWILVEPFLQEQDWWTTLDTSLLIQIARYQVDNDQGFAQVSDVQHGTGHEEGWTNLGISACPVHLVGVRNGTTLTTHNPHA